MFQQKILKHPQTPLRVAFLICFAFFLAYATLSVVRHNHYGSFGYDLGINNQVVWRYSTFQPPVATTAPFPDKPKLVTHVELVYALIAPFYWIWSTARMLLLLEAAFLCSGGIAVFLLARARALTVPVSLAILFSYLTFFGLQNAMWFDVHSASFGAAFMAWLLYFLHKNHTVGTLLFFLLAITAKENIAFITFFIGLIYFISRRNRISIVIMLASAAYLFFIFFIYFPHIIQIDYLYQNKEGLLSNLHPSSMLNSKEKLETIFYTLFSYGFLPLLNPLVLIPAFADLATYFVIGSDLTASHGLFMHYRVTLTPLLAWAAIGTIAKHKRLNTIPIALYLLIVVVLIQYMLHLPLSYLAKAWFWTEPSGVKHINKLKGELTSVDAVVAQNNIIPHISQRDKIYTLYPEKKKFDTPSSPCGESECDWFRWYGKPKYLFVDTSPEWDIRHFLADREKYEKGLENIEKAGIVRKYKQSGSAVLYTIEGDM
jgi:uncharacterized membrane protein